MTHAGIRKLARNGSGWKIPVPRQVVEQLGWELGEYIAIQINPDDSVTLKAVTVPAVQPTPLHALR